MKRIDSALLKKNIYRLKRLVGLEELKLVIDVAPCNLRCSMCPRGDTHGLKNESKRLMSYGLFKKIIDKFKKEKVKIKHIEVGNWGEPLINNDLPKMIRYALKEWPPFFLGEKGTIGISSNLNYLKDPDEIVLSGVDRIRVSISGMTQGIYGINHVGGNIETVLHNIKRLVEAKKRHNVNGLSLGIGYHDLIYNKAEAEEAKKFSSDNGLFIDIIPMYIPSVEDNVLFHRNREELTKFYEKFIDVEGEVRRMKLARDVSKCQFRRSVVTIDSEAMIDRCCASYETKNFLGSFFDFSIRSIPKTDSRICKVCAATPMSWR